MCVTYRSRESITKYPTGFTGTESSVVDIEISLAKLFNTALVAEDEEDLVYVDSCCEPKQLFDKCVVHPLELCLIISTVKWPRQILVVKFYRRKVISKSFRRSFVSIV